MLAAVEQKADAIPLSCRRTVPIPTPC